MALDTTEQTEVERCSVVWLIGLSRSSLSRDAKLKAFRNLCEVSLESRLPVFMLMASVKNMSLAEEAKASLCDREDWIR